MKITHEFVGDTSLVPEDPPPHGVGPVEWNNDHVVADFVPGDLPTITLTGDATGAAAAGTIPTTLATVNSDVGSFTNANITVNAKGLITAASNGSSSGSLELTDGTHDLTGVTKITVSDMTVGGTAAAATLTPNLATSIAPGIVQPDGTIITVSGGDITVAKASATAFGVVEVDNTTITAAAGVISAVQPTGANPTATASNTAVNGSATTFMRSDAAPAVQLGSSSVFGVLKVDGTSITAAGGVISAPGAGGGTVTTTGSPASGNLSKFSGATSITNGDLSGDVTTSGTLATTIKSSIALAGSPTTTTQTTGDSSTKIATTAFVQTIALGRLINVQRITATGAYTYTPTPGTNSVVIELQGAGGGGSGVASPGASFPVAMGSGAGAGAWLRVRLTSNFSGGTGSVGSHGSGGAAGNNSGGAGNDTTFVTTAGSPVTYTAHGGAASFHVGPTSAPFNVGHAAGGTAVNGDDQVPGGASYAGGAWSSFIAFAGRGGDSFYGKGGIPGFVNSANSSSAGGSASGKGAGGGGGCALGTGASVAGGDGTDGEVIIWEYS